MSVPVSVLILTKNEESDLPGSLETVAWADDVHVYDSFSDDRTLEVARKWGAHVTQRRFDDWSTHQNWGLQNIAFKHPWVLYIDADERVSPELMDSIARVLARPEPHVAFRVHRRDFFMGRWLRHVQSSPYYLRLFRPDKMHYERLVNPVSVPDGSAGDLEGFLDHHPFSKGISHWLNRHNSYSSFEARQIIENRRSRPGVSLRAALLGRDFHEKRFHQKELFYRLPGRPLVKFLVLYVLKRGFLDGTPGLTYALLQSIYEYMIVLKTRELERELLGGDGAMGIERPDPLTAK